MGTRCSVDGWGAMLQAGRLQVRVAIKSLNFFSIYLILPATPLPWGLIIL
jgi:hypothetical protein